MEPQVKKANTTLLVEWANSNMYGQVELMAGFVHMEKVAGRLRDTAEGFRTRFEAYRNSPTL